MGYWDRYAAAGYDALNVLLPYEALQDELFALMAPAAGERILVAGCGTGSFERLAIERVPELLIAAVDNSPTMLARARAKCNGLARVRHQQADLCAPLAFAEAAFDAAVMCNVLYALPDGPAALAEIARVLRPGGRLILCDRLPGSYFSHVGRAHFAGLRALPWRPRMTRWARTLAAVPALLGVSAANLAMGGKERSGAFHCYALNEVTAILRNTGLVVSETRETYAGQCWLLRAIREPADPATG